MSRSKSKRWKGHCLMCGAHTCRGQGIAARTPIGVLRKLGKRRRVSRRDVPEET